jgi:hypothetical protein
MASLGAITTTSLKGSKILGGTPTEKSTVFLFL